MAEKALSHGAGLLRGVVWQERESASTYEAGAHGIDVNSDALLVLARRILNLFPLARECRHFVSR